MPQRRDNPGENLTGRLALARTALLWEALWPLAWPIPGLVAVFVAVALFDVLPRLPGWLHAAILAGFALALAGFALRLRRLAAPTLAQARERLERDSGLAHRPLLGLADELAAGRDDPLALALWEVQRNRLTRMLRRLTLRLPAPGMARRDPLGLRFVPLLLLAIALSGGWADAGQRLLRAIEPELGPLGGPPAILQVWITPPEYTGVAPMLLESLPTARRVDVPAGSKLLAELQGGSGLAQLAIDHDWQPFAPLDTDSQRLETQLTKGSHLTVRQGYRVIGGWDIAVIQDQPPTIAWTAPPEADPDGRLRLSVEAHDDYGVAKAWAIVRRGDSPDAAPLIEPLPLGGGHPAEVRQAAWHDLTGSPWAGLAVTIQPAVQDDAGQQGLGEAVATTLPERRFHHPVARAIVEQRRLLAADPTRREEAIGRLAGIASNLDSYRGDTLVFLALVDARARLLYDRTAEAVPGVLDILWSTALHLEEGERPAAERTLDQTERDLREALADGASAAELERLMTQLQAATAAYLDALAEQAARQGLTPQPASPDQQVVTPDELQEMIERMRELSRTGSREAARQMLSEMRQLLDGLRAGLRPPPSAEAARQARQVLDDLRGITHDQRGLLDETFRRNQRQSAEPGLTEPAGGRPKGKAGKRPSQDPPAAASQEALRQRLGKLLEQLGEIGADIPDSLGQAEQAMRDAGRSLRDGDLQNAVDAQTEAVARLQEGAQAAGQALSRQLGGGLTTGVPPGVGRDPLGRPLHGPGSADDNTVKIPDQADSRKAREVLDELRRRSGQAERPPAEKDYLRRLLKQFF